MQQQQQHQHHRGDVVKVNETLFSCPVCLGLLEDPITLHCGHSCCRRCAEGFWDQETQRGQYSCPHCKATFPSRPVLGTNKLLAKVMEKVKETSTQQAATSALTGAGPADVACDFCCKTKPNKASMSCLTCLASYCPAHLAAHYSVPVLKTHQLVSALIPLQDRMCTKHNMLMEIYCETDHRCICYICTKEEHRGHRVVLAAAKQVEEQVEKEHNARLSSSPNAP